MKEVFLSIRAKIALDYIHKILSISDEITVNGAWIDVENRAKVTSEQVQCLLDRYSDIEVIRNIYADELYDEFCRFFTLIGFLIEI